MWKTRSSPRTTIIGLRKFWKLNVQYNKVLSFAIKTSCTVYISNIDSERVEKRKKEGYRGFEEHCSSSKKLF